MSFVDLGNRMGPSAKLSRMEQWTVLGSLGQPRLFGILREAEGEPQDHWTLSALLTSIDFKTRRAETVDGISWELWSGLTHWCREARSALRALANLNGLEAGDLHAKALVRPGENLGGVSDEIWIRSKMMARVMGVPDPSRDLATVQAFNKTYGPTFLADRASLLRERDRSTESSRRDAKISLWARS